MRIFFAGAGQCAEYVARRLIREGHDLTLMDSDEARCLELAESLDASIVHDDVTRNDAWLHAGLAGAELFVGCTDSDQANILACLIANELAPDALKSIRLRTPEFHEWDRMLNDLKVRVDRVVHPETDILERILRVLAIPGVSDIRTFADNRVKVFSMNISANGLLADRSIREVLDEDAMNEARVCLLFRGTSVRIPGPDEVFHAGDHIYVVTTHAAMNKTLKTMGIVPRPKLREVFIVGGGELALELARTLEERHIPVKLFERNAARCEFLADQLLDATIIKADGTDQHTLIRENIEGVDAYVPLTDDDDANLIAALLARKLGVDKVIPLVRRLDYLPLAQRLGINTTVSPRVKAADALFEFIRGADVLSVRTLGEELAEAIEIKIPADSHYVDKPLSKLNLPPGAMVAAIAPEEGDTYLPADEATIRSGDRLVIFALEEAAHRLEATVLNGGNGSR